ncbi:MULTISPECIES: hypothetical protein [Paenibacillus]|nr:MULTISPECIES: hypothetical protein [Paenibacillus]
MNNWFVVEYLIRQQQMERDQEAGVAWKYRQVRSLISITRHGVLYS